MEEDDGVANLLRFIPQYLKGFHSCPSDICGICCISGVQDSFIGRSDSIMASLVQSLVPFEVGNLNLDGRRSFGGALVICSNCATDISSLHEGLLKLKSLREEFEIVQGRLADKVVTGTGKVLNASGETVRGAKNKWKKQWNETKYIYPDLVGTQLATPSIAGDEVSGPFVKNESEFYEDGFADDDDGGDAWDHQDNYNEPDYSNEHEEFNLKLCSPNKSSSPIMLRIANISGKCTDPKLTTMVAKVFLTRVNMSEVHNISSQGRKRRCRKPPPGVLNSLEVLSGSSDEEIDGKVSKNGRKKRKSFMRAPSPDLDFTLDANDYGGDGEEFNNIESLLTVPRMRSKVIRRKNYDKSSSRRPQNKAIQSKSSLVPFHVLRPKSVKSFHRFPCPYCPHTFPLLSFLRSHEMTHLGALPFPCSHCDFKFLYALSLRKHVIGQHSLIPASSPQCNLCLRHFHKPFAKQKHMELVHTAAKCHNNLRCFLCRTMFSSQEALKEHESSPEHQGELEKARNIHCTLCNMNTFPSVEILQIHLTSEEHKKREDEEKIKPFPQGPVSCKVCGDEQNKVTFNTRKELVEHHMSEDHKEKVRLFMETSISKPVFICKDCGKSFDTPDKRQTHEDRVHVGGEGCDGKEDVVRKRSTKSSSNGIDSPSKPKKKKSKWNPKPNLKCRICGKEFANAKDLRSHRATHKDDKPFKCDLCSKSFLSLEYFRSHKKSHDGNTYLCAQCGKSYSTRESLKHHTEYYHEGKRVIKCPHCPPDDPAGQMRMAVYFRRHLFRVHRDIYMEGVDESDIRVCDICFHKIPGGDAGLETHMGAHENLKCKECGRQFKQSKSLDIHKRSHTGERPFLCSVCGKGFYSKHNLDVHLMRHAGDKKYKCDECQVSFVTRPELIRHWKGVMHGTWKRKPKNVPAL